ncbi:MFS transporter [Actinobacteria bacterium YIM 96077]|uniref:MFS transporter n=1 Tax=Phytoactinopolyspora halophila TaxID=1981511 RepID=A0A329R2P9_9ACTN|nr:MFS transporter [Phytoactinopolyspora halophila]AYY12132.1 MFS transporter [Actinobacteria bacterium YIM 96077]RAW18633.1 MFS transporter [Phytoactinopolyspora halophila]
MTPTPEPSTPTTGILGSTYRKLTMGIVATVSFIAFEAMAVATAMPKAVPDLDGMELYAFAFSSFFTTSLLALVVSGEICDRRGPKLPILIGATTFAAGLLLAGGARAMWPFLAGRATQGFGAGMVIVALYVTVGRSYDEHRRPRVFAAMSAAWVLPSIVGPLVAGLLADHASWRWVFLGLAPFVLLPITLMLPSVRAIDGPPASGPVIRKRRVPLAFAAALAMGLLQYAGTRADVLALVLCGVAAVLLIPSVPKLLPIGALRLRRGLPTVVVMRGILAGSFFGAEAFLPLILVAERGLSSTLAGLSLTGGALGWVLGAWYQGRSTTSVPRHLLVRVGCGIVATAIACLALILIPFVPAATAAVVWTLGAVGMGMAMASVSVLLFQLSPPEEHGTNSAALQMCDNLGTITFVGLAGAIFGSAHSVEHTAAPQATTGASTWTYLVILGIMAALAAFGSWAAGRVRPQAAHHDGPATTATSAAPHVGS